jgi:hypothetical protein
LDIIFQVLLNYGYPVTGGRQIPEWYTDLYVKEVGPLPPQEEEP